MVMQKVSTLVSKDIGNYLTNRSSWNIFYNAKAEGLAGDGTTDDYADLSTLINTTIAGAEATIIFSPGTYKISTNITIPSNINLFLTKGAMLSPDSGITITINGPVEAGLWKIFTGSGTIAGSMKVETLLPQWWGAVGNGVADDTVAINNATAGGGTIYVPEGTYIVNADNPTNGSIGGIFLPDDTTLILHPKAIIKAKTSSSERYNIIRIEKSSRVKVIGGTIQGERDTHIGVIGEHGYGIFIDEGTYIDINGVKTINCWGDGIIVGGRLGIPSQYVTIKNVISDNNRRQGLSLIFCKDVLVEDSTFSNTNGTAPEAGIDIEPDLTDQSSNITVRNCRCFGNNGEGIQVYEDVTSFSLEYNHCYANGLSGIKVMLDASNGKVVGNNCSNNTFDGIWVFGAVGLGNPRSIDVIDNVTLNNGRIGIRLERCFQSNVKGNTIKDNTEQGIIVTEVSRCLIEGNCVESNTLNAMLIFNTSSYINVMNNTIKDNGGSAQVLLNTTVTQSIIANNTIQGTNTFGVLLNNTTISNVQVNNNDFSLFIGTPVLNNGLGCVVSDKRTIGGLVTAAPTTGTWERGQLLYNSTPVSGGSTGFVCVIAGTPGTWLPFGVIDLQGSIVFDPASLVDGAGVISPDVTVIGAVLGDFALVSAPYDLQSVICTAYVSATDTARIKLQNESGLTVDLASGTWKVKVIKQ